MTECRTTDRAVLHTFLDETARSRPHAPAVRDRTGRWSYSEFTRASDAAADWLRGAGVGVGDRVVVRASPTRSTLALMYGCFRLGAVFVPLGTTATRHQLGHVLADARPALFVTDEDAHLGWSSVPSRSLPEDAATWPATSPSPSHTAGASGPEAARTALMLYTSGSTGLPKAVVCPHAAVSFAVSAIARCLRYRADDVVHSCLPLSFDYGLYQVFLSVSAGSELVLGDASRGAALLADLRRSAATVVPLVPSLASMLLMLARRSPTPTSVRLFTNTGEHLSSGLAAELRERFPGAGVQMMFGITECKRVAILEVDGDLQRPGCVGRALPGTRVVVVDEAGRPLPAGETGEITVRGPHLMAGYWDAPELTGHTYRTDPGSGERVLHTGDFGRLDGEGYLYFEGRRDELFKRHGVRTSVTEIETAAKAVDRVRAAAVVPPTGHRDAVLYVTGDVEPEAVLHGVRDLLGPARTPSVCRVLESMPLGANGKVARGALRGWEDPHQ
ncbi:class I adenylate-forming enzyme family protein [Streptomyces sp. NPDC048514]|uniref:class I adenylate-forming enzyme family protein n=1 Tax=Streptomyces sp. NPDC048514 TaxID=3365564 RepID=UPI003712BA95